MLEFSFPHKSKEDKFVYLICCFQLINYFQSVSTFNKSVRALPGCAFGSTVILTAGENVKVPVSLSFFVQLACVNHIHHTLTGCHSVPLLKKNASCDTSACSPAIRHYNSVMVDQKTHTEVHIHAYVFKAGRVVDPSLYVCG